MNRIGFRGTALSLVLLFAGEGLAHAETRQSAATTEGPSALSTRGSVFDSAIFSDRTATETAAPSEAKAAPESSTETATPGGWLARVTGECRMSRRPVAGVRVPLHACRLFLAEIDSEIVIPIYSKLSVRWIWPMAARID
jgi:hypothetical protein